MMSIETANDNQLSATSLEHRRDTLQARLAHGYDQIERAVRAGEDVSRWEHGWLRLLREYERVCEQIAARNH